MSPSSIPSASKLQSINPHNLFLGPFYFLSLWERIEVRAIPVRPLTLALSQRERVKELAPNHL
jgi:hypothetical protein